MTTYFNLLKKIIHNKKSVMLCLLMIVAATGSGQINVKQKIKDKTTQRADQKVDEAIDKGLDKLENAGKKKDKPQVENAAERTEEETEGRADVAASKKDTSPSFTSFSKFDFVPGEKIMFYEEFAEGTIGDFPVNWNTDGSGELVTLNNLTGKWLKWSAGVGYSPVLNNSFPDNFTLEFDILMTEVEGKEKPYFGLNIYSADKDYFEGTEGIGNAGIFLVTQGDWEVYKWNESGGGEKAGGTAQIQNTSLYNKKAHVAIWGQKQRLRVYVNETKVLDLPQALPLAKLNRIKWTNNPGLNYGNDDMAPVYLSNIRIATGLPDMRSKLITEGKLVTRGILFDVGSDKIKGESYGTLKEIAQVLKENPGIKVKIVGHTDADGNDASNLDLSKRRAAAVKTSLQKDFGVNVANIQTDGKGESEPASPNTTAEGKANNRRVEFIKL
jgi:outer membrane protein OmpA-like peptidoglycan-associated protein/DNA-directed RNA polymerase subunit L